MTSWGIAFANYLRIVFSRDSCSAFLRPRLAVAPAPGSSESLQNHAVQMSDSLQKCSTPSCVKAAAVIVHGQLYCVTHALEAERKLPPQRPANAN